MNLAWMAWTPYTAGFFLFILASLILMIVWEKFSPGGAPKKGILRLNTTRGDRLFISYLGSGYIFLGWIFLLGPTLLWLALAVCFIYAILVFKFV